MTKTQQATRIRLAPPGQALARVRRFAWETTPGKLRLARLALVLGVLLAGAVGVFAARARAEAIRDIAEHLEPLHARVTTLYRSLADADTTVAVGFLSGPVESREIRARYDADVDLAMASLAQAGIQAGEEITYITRQMPVYTSLVERARANNRQGLTVGTAYLRSASDLMQNHILPRAAELQRRQAVRLDDAYQRVGSAPFVALVACGASLAGLILAQVFLFRRTHRVINIGLAVASVAVLTGLLWWTIAGMVLTRPLSNSHRHIQAVSEALGPAHIAALRSRTVESLGLARTGTATERDFDAQMQQVSRGVARALANNQTDRDLVEAAAREASTYTSAHHNVRQLDSSPQYPQAVEAAVGSQEGSSATAFGRLDNALLRAVERERAVFGSDIHHAQRLLTGLPAATGALALAAAAGVVLGVRQRLEEYR